MPIIVIERGNDKGKSVRLDFGKTYVFGRDPNASSIPLSDTMTSRRHFSVKSTDAGFVLEDLGSTNGTFLNDERVQSSRLNVGDKVQAGETILSFLSDKREESAQGLVGKTIGGYRIIERVGRGGMGTVYRATQLSLNRTVALKLLSARLLKDDTFIQKFQSEARAAGQLNHPNIVQVYDVARDRNLHFFSMEFMDGGSIQDKIGKDGRLTWEEALDVLAQAARALIFAEKNNIVHRDVKPDNLMVTQDGQIKLADLGLARRTDQDPEEQGIFGTPHFISPEQARGLSVDHRADLYSLGATAYRILSGRTPFLGNNVQEIIQKQINDEPAPLRKLAPDVPEEVAEVVERLMRKKPEDRYPSAQALLEDLEQIRLKYHLRAAGVGTGRGIYVAVGVALLAVAAVVVVLLSRQTPPPVNPDTVTTILVQPTTTQGPREILVEDTELQAKAAFQDVALNLEPGDLAATWKPRRGDWDAAVAAYRSVAADFPATVHGGKASRRADEIEAFVRERIAQETAARERAEAAWKSLSANVTRALEEERHLLALRLLAKGLEDETTRSALRIIPDAALTVETWQSEQPGSVHALFLAAWDEARRSAGELRRSGDHAGAAAVVRAFLDRALGTGVEGPGDLEGPFAEVRRSAEQLLGEIAADFRAGLEASLDADRQLYFKTYVALRHHAERESGHPDNPVFEYRFAAAADAMEALLAENGPGPRLATGPWRDRAARKVRQLRSCQALLDDLVARLNESRLAVNDWAFPEDIAGGEEVAIELNDDKSPVATRIGLEVRKKIKVGSRVAVVSEQVHWDRFLPSEFWIDILLMGRRWEFTPEDHAAAARFLAECAILEGLEPELAAAGTALDPAERRALSLELQALQAYDRLLRAQQELPPEQWHIRAAQFVNAQAHTDLFVLLYGYDEPGDRALLPAADRQAFIDEQLRRLEQPR